MAALSPLSFLRGHPLVHQRQINHSGRAAQHNLLIPKIHVFYYLREIGDYRRR